MGCGCNKGKAGQTFQWTSSDGASKKTLRTEVEARALVIRQGGTYVVK